MFGVRFGAIAHHLSATKKGRNENLLKLFRLAQRFARRVPLTLKLTSTHFFSPSIQRSFSLARRRHCLFAFALAPRCLFISSEQFPYYKRDFPPLSLCCADFNDKNLFDFLFIPHFLRSLLLL